MRLLGVLALLAASVSVNLTHDTGQASNTDPLYLQSLILVSLLSGGFGLILVLVRGGQVASYLLAPSILLGFTTGAGEYESAGNLRTVKHCVSAHSPLYMLLQRF